MIRIKPRRVEAGDPPPTVHQIVLPWPPSVNKYWRMGRGRMHKSEAGKAYAAEAGFKARAMFKRKPFTGRLRVEIFAFPPDKRARDIDNLLKAPLDALKGICFDDDSQIDELMIMRDSGRLGSGGDARLVVLVSETKAQLAANKATR